MNRRSLLGIRAEVSRRAFVTGFAATLAVPFATQAQPQGKVYRVGYLAQGSPPTTNPIFEAFRQQLRELGYVEGQNLIIEHRYAEGRGERLPDLAAELVRLKVNVIVAGGTPAPLAAKHATGTIPIVMAAAGDPLGTGLVTNLAKPEGNVTGLSNESIDLTAKRLQLLKEILPRLSRVAVLWNAANIVAVTHMRETEAAARTLGLQLQSLEVRSPDDFENARLERRLLDVIRPDGGAGALFLIDDPLVFRYHSQVADFAARNRLPATAIYKQFAAAGAAPHCYDPLRGRCPGDFDVFFVAAANCAFPECPPGTRISLNTSAVPEFGGRATLDGVSYPILTGTCPGPVPCGFASMGFAGQVVAPPFGDFTKAILKAPVVFNGGFVHYNLVDGQLSVSSEQLVASAVATLTLQESGFPGFPDLPGFPAPTWRYDGIRYELEPTPEPTTLLLFGTTMAGVGLAAWRKLRDT